MGLRYYTRLLLLLAPGIAAAQQTSARAVPPVAREAPFQFKEPAESAPSRELKAESAIYLQRRLGMWREADARQVLGEPQRYREALKQGSVTGLILAFPDPTSRYREFELLFDSQTRTLRAVYIYPWHMSWNDCRELWGTDVNATQLANGNVFRSYLTRHLDVLVDQSGSVINLGIY